MHEVCAKCLGEPHSVTVSEVAEVRLTGGGATVTMRCLVTGDIVLQRGTLYI